MKNYVWANAFLFMGVLLISINNSSAQSATLNVKYGILYTVDGEWGDGIRLHYSSCKGNCKAKVNIEEGLRKCEYYLPKMGVFEISFTAKAGMKYSIEKGNPVEVKEGREVLKTAVIKKVSVDKTKDEYIKLSSQSDLAYLHWEANVKLRKASEFDYLLRIVDTVWGCNNMGILMKDMKVILI